MAEKAHLRIGVIGCGHWGPNHIRVFEELDRSSVVACADLNRSRLARVQARFPHVRTTTDYRELLDDGTIDALVLATPTATHFELARASLEAGKHILVEKPLCGHGREARELDGLVRSRSLVLMVGHVFLFNGGIVRLRELIAAGELGQVQYLDAVRTNLGPVRGDVNALYDLATHDISICNYLLGSSPVAVSALGRCISQRTIEDVAFATLHYPDGTIAHLHASWLNPRKVRTLTVVGSTKMAHWDDIDPQDMLRLYDKGLAEEPYYDSFGEFQALLRSADVHVPAVCRAEPLRQQAEAFVAWVLDGKHAGPDVTEGGRVVATLEAAMQSMRNGGTMARVPDPFVTTRVISADELPLLGTRQTFASGREAPTLTPAPPRERQRGRRH
jgi:predicted dehydrogenase